MILPRSLPCSLSRRRALAAAMAALAAGCASRSPAPRGRVLVIGAGFAGLSAARALRQSGWQVTVLEARNRTGGRVHTDRSVPGHTFDLGPSWLHAGPQNPLKELARGAQIATRVTDYANMRFAVQRDGKREIVPRADVLRFAQRFSGTIESTSLWAALDRQIAARRGTDTRGLSVADVFEAGIRRIEAESGPVDPGLIALQRRILELNLASPLDQVGFEALLEESDTNPGNTFLPADDHYVLGGMDQLTRLLELDLDIRLSEPVRRIEWRRGLVRVDTRTGVYEAGAAVITIPVGMLAGGSIEFAPALPPEKIAAARRLPMGLLNKAFVLFPKPFWETELDFLAFDASPPPLFYAWLNLQLYKGQPALVGFTSGAMARQVERMTDAEVRNRVFNRLRTARPQDIPDPLEVRVSRWAADPWAQGAYSFLGLGATPDDRVVLGHPVANTLFFAGEATHRDDPSSVHGAWWSGLRAAKEVLGEA